MSTTPASTIQLTAIYGTFTLNLQPHTTVDVTTQIESLCSGNILTLPTQFNFGGLPAGAVPYHHRFLQVSAGHRTYYIAEDRYNEPVVIDLADTEKHISIVYYLYLNHNSDWRGVISGQLTHLKSYGILPEADLYIHLTDTHQLAAEAEALIKRIVPEAILSFSTINQYEYPGIKLIYDLAKRQPERSYLYFHSKGMSYGRHSRSLDEITLLTRTFGNWRKNMQYLGHNGIEKAGLFPAMTHENGRGRVGEQGGWIWYNFWYATGKYLANCLPPEITGNRYYYEEWLGSRRGEEWATIHNDCKSLYQVKVINKTYFTRTEAIYHEHRLIYRTLHDPIPKGLPYIIRSSYTLQVYLKMKRWLASLTGKK